MRVHLELIREQIVSAEPLHDGFCELVKGIRDDHDLAAAPDPVEELVRPQIGAHIVRDFLQPRERESGAVQRFDAASHQLLEIGDVARGEMQLLHSEVVPEVGPDLGSEHAFKVDRGDHGAGIIAKERGEALPLPLEDSGGLLGFASRHQARAL